MKHFGGREFLGIRLSCFVAIVWLGVCSSAASATWYLPGASTVSGGERRVRSEVILEARTHVGKDYRWNQSGPDAFDCSGFVYYVLKTALGQQRFPLSYSLSTMKGYRNQSVYYRDQLKNRGAQVSCETANEGDIVFFSPIRKGDNHHIGLITNPRMKYFITAQGKASGVAEHIYSERSYWGRHQPECYRNLWITAR